MLKLYENIKERRIALGMTQTDLAELMGYADKGMISRIESGQVDISQSKILAFAKALQTTPSALMGWDGDEEAPEADLRKNEVYARYEALRNAKGVTDYAVAKACQIGRTTFADWRAGRSIPRTEKLVKIANYFGVSLEDLYNGPKDQTPQDPKIKELFSLADKATPEQLAQAVRIFHALIGTDEQDNN